MLDFIDNYQQYFVWIGLVSTLVFVVSIALIPYLLGLIDEHYFVGLEQRKLKIKSLSHFLQIAIKSLLGFVLLIAGVIMLVTPGQGVISILFGLFLMEFPGKKKIQLKLIHHDPTFKTLNWLRIKSRKPPFKR